MKGGSRGGTTTPHLPRVGWREVRCIGWVVWYPSDTERVPSAVLPVRGSTIKVFFLPTTIGEGGNFSQPLEYMTPRSQNLRL